LIAAAFDLRRGTFALSIAVLVCVMTQTPVAALAAQRGVEKHHATHKKHHARKSARRTDVMYRWSADELMLGGVDPASIGKGNDANPANDHLVSQGRRAAGTAKAKRP